MWRNVATRNQTIRRLSPLKSRTEAKVVFLPRTSHSARKLIFAADQATVNPPVVMRSITKAVTGIKNPGRNGRPIPRTYQAGIVTSSPLSAATRKTTTLIESGIHPSPVRPNSFRVIVLGICCPCPPMTRTPLKIVD